MLSQAQLCHCIFCTLPLHFCICFENLTSCRLTSPSDFESKQKLISIIPFSTSIDTNDKTHRSVSFHFSMPNWHRNLFFRITFSCSLSVQLIATFNGTQALYHHSPLLETATRNNERKLNVVDLCSLFMFMYVSKVVVVVIVGSTQPKRFTISISKNQHINCG